MTAKRSRHILMTTDCVGGIWQYSTDLAEALAEMQERVTLAVLGPAPDAEHRQRVAKIPNVEMIETGLPLDWLTRSPEPVRCAARKVAELADRTDADLVHCNMPILAGAAQFSVPVVAVAHGCIATWWKATRIGPLDSELRWHREMMREGLLAAQRVIAPTTAYARMVRETYELPQEPLAIHNGRFPPPNASSSSTKPCGAGLTVGRLWDKAKNMPLLDRVAASIDMPLFAVGPVQSPAGERVFFRNLQPIGKMNYAEIGSLLALRPVFVSASVFEPFGLAALEAAIAGCPLVLADIETFRELWDGAALFADPAEPSSFRSALAQLSQDPPKRSALGEAARERARTYSPHATARAMRQVYDASLVQGGREAA